MTPSPFRALFLFSEIDAGDANLDFSHPPTLPRQDAAFTNRPQRS
jgi:hypothetical protein